MALISKCSRLSYEVGCHRHSDLKDRISNLPDDIIGNILSSLTTKEAVATSILSKRWLHAWNFITNLDFKDQSMPSDRDVLRLAFIRFVQHVLELRKILSLHKFRLSCYKCGYHTSQTNSWIDYAVRCNVKHLDISASLNDDYFPLSSKIFLSTTLTVLELNGIFFMTIPSTFCLPSLKIIHLSGVIFPDDDSFTRFVCGCPVLEELDLKHFTGSDLHVIKIVAPLLKRLDIDKVFIDRNSRDDDVISYKIIINTPSLVRLYISNGFADLYAVADSPKLIVADIIFDEDIEEYWAHWEGNADFLKGISSGQSLHIRWYPLESMMRGLIAEGHYNLPRFPMLKYLELCVDYERDFLADLLQNSPQLESLVYEEVPTRGQRKFECQTISTSLKVVNIDVNVGLESCAEMVNCFLKKAKSLEKLTVSAACPERVEQELKMVNYFRKNDEEVAEMEVKYYSYHVTWTLHYDPRVKSNWYNKNTKKV